MSNKYCPILEICTYAMPTCIQSQTTLPTLQILLTIYIFSKSISTVETGSWDILLIHSHSTAYRKILFFSFFFIFIYIFVKFINELYDTYVSLTNSIINLIKRWKSNMSFIYIYTHDYKWNCNGVSPFPYRSLISGLFLSLTTKCFWAFTCKVRLVLCLRCINYAYEINYKLMASI